MLLWDSLVGESGICLRLDLRADRRGKKLLAGKERKCWRVSWHRRPLDNKGNGIGAKEMPIGKKDQVYGASRGKPRPARMGRPSLSSVGKSDEIIHRAPVCEGDSHGEIRTEAAELIDPGEPSLRRCLGHV